MRDKSKKKTTGKPKGTGSALGIVGSASKAGMQGKQGKGPSIKRKPFQKKPNPAFPGRGLSLDKSINDMINAIKQEPGLVGSMKGAKQLMKKVSDAKKRTDLTKAPSRRAKPASVIGRRRARVKR